MKESLDYVYKTQKELSVYSGVSSLLGWDQLTYMPVKGSQARSEQLSLLSRLSHEKVISDEFWNHIQKLNNKKIYDKLKNNDKLVVSRLKEDVEKARKIPSWFVEKIAKTTTLAYNAWEKAREKNDYSIFSPHLVKIIDLEKQYCEFIDLPGHPYNSLLDNYEEGMTVDILKKEFNYLKKNLVEILDKVKDSKKYNIQTIFDEKFDVEKQKQICNMVIEKMGLPKDCSRIDISTHPFTTSIGDEDVRITTNYERGNSLFSFFSTIHEAGHGLYELGLPKKEFKDTVISDTPSLGIHESQSRFWENMIARSKDFWVYFYPVFKEKFPSYFNKCSFDEWYEKVNTVQPSFIRVEADELTYCLHIILRFEIELMLINDEIKTTDLPAVWNEKMNDMLGVKPNNDKEGVLQDMHWSGGSIGYFPTYAIGTIYASQLFKKLSIDKPDISNHINQGDYSEILSWLREHVYEIGRKMNADEIIKKTCGEGLNSSVFLDYLKEKYFDIYMI